MLGAGAREAGRGNRWSRSGEIQLLPVTKFFPASDVEELYRLGCREFGESRDQEAAAKVALLDQAGHADIRWHMVGNLQRNKAKSVAHWAHSVHSVDNARLVTALDGARGAGEKREPLGIYLQVSLDGDNARGGVDIAAADEIDELCAQVVASEHLELAGLMALPPGRPIPTRPFADSSKNMNVSVTVIRRRTVYRRECPTTWRPPLNMGPHVCVSERR